MSPPSTVEKIPFFSVPNNQILSREASGGIEMQVMAPASGILASTCHVSPPLVDTCRLPALSPRRTFGPSEPYKKVIALTFMVSLNT